MIPQVSCRDCGWKVSEVYAGFDGWTHVGNRWRCPSCPRPARSLFGSEKP